MSDPKVIVQIWDYKLVWKFLLNKNQMSLNFNTLPNSIRISGRNLCKKSPNEELCEYAQVATAKAAFLQNNHGGVCLN
jgi:hypothetical protein